MNRVNIPRIVIAATQSSSGKTTVVTGILRALKNAGKVVQPYKVGPDYIDPSYHGMAAGRLGHNLDTWLVPETKIEKLFAYEAQDADISVIEGVMGLYDGGKKGISSTAALAKTLKAPVVLVINCQSMGDSAAAIALGFKMYDPEVNLAGVILNRLGSPTHCQMIKEAMERLDIPVLGAVYRNDEMHMPERHLGLTPAQEQDVQDTVDKIADTIKDQVDLEGLIAIANSAPALEVDVETKGEVTKQVTIAVAKDKAFSFYYPASLQALRNLGAEIKFFSPLTDKALPADSDAVIIGGGFPELFASDLAANIEMLQALRQANQNGMPIYGECGGFMYLMEGIYDFEENFHSLVGIIPAKAQMHKKLQTVGYVQAELIKDSILGHQGEVLKGHEFHFSTQVEEQEKENFPWAYEFTKMRNNSKYLAGYSKGNVLGSYLHLHFLGNPTAAASFIQKAQEFKGRKSEGEQ